MRYLLDTGILARLPHRADPFHQIACQAVRELGTQNHELVTSTQNVAEFWNLCTRPPSARGGFGLSVELTRTRLVLLERFITVLKEPDSAYAKWKKLVMTYGVSGKQVHDARLAALMSAYRIKRILTFNAADFVRYPQIEVATPQQVMSTP